MKQLYPVIALSVAAAFGSAAHAATVDFSGYFRAGTGLNTAGGTMTCFKAPGADTKWRLGNECDYVIEPNLNATLATLDDKSEWHVHFMPSVFKAWGGAADGAGDQSLITRFGQVYAYGNNIPQLLNGTVWAGRRFYNRLQFGINDYFIEHNDGDGFGLENMDVGIGKLSAAVMLNPNGNNLAVNNDNRMAIPLRLTDIKLGSTKLDVYGTLESQTKSKNQAALTVPAETKDGYALGVYYTVPTSFATIMAGLRYNKNEDFSKDNKSSGGQNTQVTRAIVQLSGGIGAIKTNWDFITMYRVKKDTLALTKEKLTSVGARTDTHIGGPFRFLAEIGTDRVTPEGQATRTLNKLTLATAISAGKDAWSRPTVRLFYTYANWNEATRINLGNPWDAANANGNKSNGSWYNGGDTNAAFGNKKAGSSFGVQTEAWW